MLLQVWISAFLTQRKFKV